VDEHIVHQVVFFQLSFGEADRKVRSVDGDVEFFEDVRQRAEVVFVPVRQNNGGQVLPVFFQKVEIGNRNVNPVHALFWKPHAGVNDDHVVCVPHGHTIHPELADAAERDDLQYIAHCVLYSTLLKTQRATVSIDNTRREKFSRVV
jgi:hypothetical protein